MVIEPPPPPHFRRSQFGDLLRSDPISISNNNHTDQINLPHRPSISNSAAMSADASPYLMSPWNQPSPYTKSPWISSTFNPFDDDGFPRNGVIGSLVREEGHIYSLAVSGDFLYTGSDSKNIRVWKNLKEWTGFKSNSGLVKAIIISGRKIFTGHQDGKIRVWKVSKKNPSSHKRVGTLPCFKDYVKCSMNPKNYVEVRRNKNVLRIKHYDAVSSLSLDEEQGLLYSGSWDKTLKVWRISDSKCLESIDAHEDAVNSVVVGFGCLVFTGSADGSVKVWKRESYYGKIKHVLDRVLLRQENAVTALAVSHWSGTVYCGSSDGYVNFWERGHKNQSFSHGGVLRGHKMAVLCLATAGKLVLSGSADKNICVWRREDNGAHTCLSVLTGHTGPVKCIAVEQDHVGRHDDGALTSSKGDQRWIVYTGSLDSSVKVWRVWERAPELKTAVRVLEPDEYAVSDLDSPNSGGGRLSFSNLGA